MSYTLKKIAFAFMCILGFSGSGHGQWEIIKDLPTPRSGVFGFTYQGKLYVIGGRDASGLIMSKVEIYDTVEENWEFTLPDLQVARENASAAVFDNAFWVIGGRDSNGRILESVERFTIDGTGWTQSDTLKVKREGHSAFISGDKLFVAGGFGGNEDDATFLSSFESIQPSQYDWQIEENIELNLARRAFACVAMADTVYMVGGFSSIGPLKVVEIYHPALGVELRKTLMVPRGGVSASVIQDEQLYVIGGRGQDNRPAAAVESLETDTGLWRFSSTINFPRSDALTLSSGKYIYLIGGKNQDGVPIGKVERFSEGVTTVVGDTPLLPSDYDLAQNYPNPFNPETRISFTLPTATHGKTTLTIYDIQGREIAVLLNAELHGGLYSVIWDGRSAQGVRLPSGIYIYTLKNPAFPVMTRKMILVR